MRAELVVTRRNLPHWELGGSTYFLTYRCIEDVTLNEVARSIVLDNWRYWHGKRYLLHAAVVMPDHVHILTTPKSEYRPQAGGLLSDAPSKGALEAAFLIRRFLFSNILLHTL